MASEDPARGMLIEGGESQHSGLMTGKTFYFCSDGCKKAFDENPLFYLK